MHRHMLVMKIELYRNKISGEDMQEFVKTRPVYKTYSNATIPVGWVADKNLLEVSLPDDLGGTYSLTL